MQIQDVFNITGRGTVVTGRIASGTVATGDALCLTAADGRTRSLQVAGIEQFRKMSESASAGDNVGLLVSGLTKSDIAIGDMLEPACD